MINKIINIGIKKIEKIKKRLKFIIFLKKIPIKKNITVPKPKIRNIFSILRILGMFIEIKGAPFVHVINNVRNKIEIENDIWRFWVDKGQISPNNGNNVFIERPRSRSNIILNPIEYKKFSY
jgi:hypothetical protein